MKSVNYKGYCHFLRTEKLCLAWEEVLKDVYMRYSFFKKLLHIFRQTSMFTVHQSEKLNSFILFSHSTKIYMTALSGTLPDPNDRTSAP